MMAAFVAELATSVVLLRHGIDLTAHVQAAQQVMPAQNGPIASPDQLKGSGRIYFIQMGPHTAPYSLDDLAAWLKSKYGLDVQVLPPTKLDQAAWDSSRKQYISELLNTQIRREHPDLAANPNATIIAFTDADMFSVHYTWEFNRAMRDKRQAVISSARMQDTIVAGTAQDAKQAEQHLQQRMRRMLLKEIAILYWHLSPNNNPGSLVQAFLDPDVPVDDIFVADLEPERTKYGRYEGEPCLFLHYSPKTGITRPDGNVIRSCFEFDDATPDESQETFELDLRLGLLVDRHTDFYIPDSVPIAFERVTRDGWTGSMGFGISGTHTYDKFLQSKDMVTIELIKEDGGRYHLERRPKAVPILALVKYVDTDISGRFLELSWHATPYEHFDLKRYDGQVETYLPCDDKVICYEVGLRNPDGHALVFERDAKRRLVRLTSPGKHWLSFSYGPASSIVSITDSRGRKVFYGYDDRNRLVKVTYPSGEIYSYEYDAVQHLLSVSVAPDAKSPSRVILRNTYKRGRLATETLADGSTYSYTYEPPTGLESKWAYVSTPDGRTFEVEMCDGCSIIRERTKPAKPNLVAARRMARTRE